MDAYKKFVIKTINNCDRTSIMYDLVVPTSVSDATVKRNLEMAERYIWLLNIEYMTEDKINEHKKLCDKYYDLILDLISNKKLRSGFDVFWYYIKNICGYTYKKHKFNVYYELHW